MIFWALENSFLIQYHLSTDGKVGISEANVGTDRENLEEHFQAKEGDRKEQMKAAFTFFCLSLKLNSLEHKCHQVLWIIFHMSFNCDGVSCNITKILLF